MGTVEQGIEAANDGLSLYHTLIKYIEPLKEIKEFIDGLNEYRINYSAELTAQIGQLKEHTINGIDEYVRASENIYEWASLTATHLQLFVKLFDNYDRKKFAAQKQLLIEMLDGGVAQMRVALEKYGNSSNTFSSADGAIKVLHKKFIELRKHIESNLENLSFINQIDWTNAEGHFDVLKKVDGIVLMCLKLLSKFEEAIDKTAYVRELLLSEIQYISILKTHIQQTVRFVNLNEMSHVREAVMKSAERLIANYEDYQKEHS